MSQQDPPKMFNNSLWRTAFSVFLLIIGVYFTTLSIPSFAAATLPEQQTCPDGQEKDGALCYPKCDTGYTGVGPLCWQTCPSGYTDTGAFCTKVVTQKKYGRSDGTIPTGCPAGQENQAGLCYKPCKSGDKAEGPLCFKPCPAGTTDIGALCSSTKAKDTYTRPVGTIPNECPAGQENQAGLCYKPCDAGDSAEGPLCFKPCPAGTKDIGALCSSTTPKDTYTRAVGTIPNVCPAGQENQAGLCYKPCDAGYNGEGPVCTKPCPAGTTDIGLLCSSTTPKNTYTRAVGTIPQSCGAGQEKDGALCYPQCKSGYYGVGPVCWQSCKSGYRDDGASCYNNLFDWYFKDTYGRGGGSIPSSCPSGKVNEAGLCYDPCQAGYKGIGLLCSKICPAGTTDTGAFCEATTAQASYGRGAGTIPSSCPSGKVNEAGLCYDPCQSGYKGVGLLCSKTCPAGTTDTGAFCEATTAQSSYGRGAGTIPSSCPSGKVYEAGLCYSPCQAGYTGVGALCSQTCPAGTTDTGAFCDATTAKASYGRGAGTIPTGCPTGQVNEAGLCYTACKAGYSGEGPLCWKTCPDGSKDTGLFCDYSFTKESQGRGAGDIPPCTTGRKYDTKYTGVLPDYLNPSTFTMIIASDTQFPWWRGADDPDCNTDECVLEMAKLTNTKQIKAMNNIQQAAWTVEKTTGKGTWPTLSSLTIGGGTTITKPLGVIMNGDLTAYWHPWQVKLYRQYYEPDYEKNPTHPVLSLPIFPGLGNHDYANNVPEISGETCYYNSLDKSMCGKKAVSYIKNMVYCDGVSNFVNTLVQRFDEDSLAYSWDIGNYHFVQLNNYPTYAASSIKIKSAIAWLKTDLATATKNGQHIVLNFHDYGEHMPKDDPDFLDAIKGANVVALFAGHIHTTVGESGTIHGTQIPFFRSGASEYNRFLLVEFGSNYMNVGVINSQSGGAKFVNSQTKTYVFP